MSHILFPLGMRLSTWAFVLAFEFIAVVRRDWRPIAAMLAWMLGWEAVWSLTSFLTHGGGYGWWGAARLAIGPVVAWWLGVRPTMWPLLAAFAVGAVWVAAGFHVNEHHATHIAVGSEILNEVAKSLWALAYLLPLMPLSRRVMRPAVQPARAGGDG